MSLSNGRQVNISTIANTELNNSTGNGTVEFVNGILTLNGTSAPDGTEVEVVKLPLSEYYSVYAINYCEGTYLDEGTSAVITRCSTPSLSRHFNLITIIKDAIKAVGKTLNLTLSLNDLEFPDGFQSAFSYADSAGSAMIVFFVAAALFLVLATLVAIVALFRVNRAITMLLFITSVVSSSSSSFPQGKALKANKSRQSLL